MVASQRPCTASTLASSKCPGEATESCSPQFHFRPPTCSSHSLYSLAVARMQPKCEVYRGMNGMKLPPSFTEKDKFGIRGAPRVAVSMYHTAAVLRGFETPHLCKSRWRRVRLHVDDARSDNRCKVQQGQRREPELDSGDGNGHGESRCAFELAFTVPERSRNSAPTTHGA